MHCYAILRSLTSYFVPTKFKYADVLKIKYGRYTKDFWQVASSHTATYGV